MKLLVRLSMALLIIAAPATPSSAAKPGPLSLQTHNGGFFSVKKPTGWKVNVAGHCSTFAFVARDPNAGLRQVFYFSSAGPVYLSAYQKQIDHSYMAQGGYPIAWADMPVVDPLTPANFLRNWSSIARSGIGRSFISNPPIFDNFQTVSSKDISCPFPGGKRSIIRGVFSVNGKIGQGMFIVSVMPYTGFLGGPGCGTGYGMQIMGITAGKDEFASMEPVLVKSLDSLVIQKSWVDSCVSQSEEAFRGVLKAGQTLRESSEIVHRGWEARTKIDDAVAQRKIDQIRGVERIYDPGTGSVYEVDAGFYDKYRLNPGRYNLAGLQPIPPDKIGLYNKGTLDGRQHIRIQ